MILVITSSGCTIDEQDGLDVNTPHLELAQELQTRGHDVILVDYQPTSEMMIIDFSKKIKERLPDNIALHSLKLRETGTSHAEWYASDN